MGRTFYSSDSTPMVCKPLNESTLTYVTKVYNLLAESSSSLCLRANLTRALLGTFRTPLDHTNLLRETSIRTSGVPIIDSANFLISRMALGALFLNCNPWILLCRLMVYSRVTTSFMGDFADFLSDFVFAILVRGFHSGRVINFTSKTKWRRQNLTRNL